MNCFVREELALSRLLLQFEIELVREKYYALFLLIWEDNNSEFIVF